MAIAFDAASSGSVSSGSSLTFSHTVASGSDRALFVSTGYYTNTVSVTGITYNGVSLTKQRRYNDGTRAATSEVWYLAAPDVGTYNVVITLSGAWTSNWVAAAISLTGVNQTTPIEVDNGGTVVFGSHTSHSSSVTTVTADAWVLDHLLYIYCGDASPSVGGQTERSHVYSFIVGLDTSTRGPIATPASSSAGWTFTDPGAATSQIIYAVKPSAAGIVTVQPARRPWPMFRAANY